MLRLKLQEIKILQEKLAYEISSDYALKTGKGVGSALIQAYRSLSKAW